MTANIVFFFLSKLANKQKKEVPFDEQDRLKT